MARAGPGERHALRLAPVGDRGGIPAIGLVAAALAVAVLLVVAPAFPLFVALALLEALVLALLAAVAATAATAPGRPLLVRAEREAGPGAVADDGGTGAHADDDEADARWVRAVRGWHPSRGRAGPGGRRPGPGST